MTEFDALTHLDPAPEESAPLGSLALIRRLLLPVGHSQRLVISPLVDARQIGTSTIDLRLGTEWEALRPYRFGALDPGEDPETAHELLQDGADEFKLTAGQRHGAVLHPGELLLALTLEYLQLPTDLWGLLDGRSTWAREGLQVHATAGMVDAGFSGFLTLELQNTGRIPMVLYPGLRVAQLAFFPVHSTAYDYGAKPHAAYVGQSRARSRFVTEPEHQYRYRFVQRELENERLRTLPPEPHGLPEPLDGGAGSDG
jgi:dCTP deaminase